MNNALLQYFDKEMQESLEQRIHGNLTSLLNSRKREITFDTRYKELYKSNIEFGLPDFSSFYFSSKKTQKELSQNIKRSIELFEPRLENIDIFILDNDKTQERILKIRIEAMIKTTQQAATFELEVK